MDFLTNANHEVDANHIIQDVHNDVKKFAGNVEQSDDMTMLALRINGFYQELEVPSTIDSFDKISEFTNQKFKEKNVEPSIISKMDVVIDELFSNVVKYSKSESLKYYLFVERNMISIKFKYGGIAFDITKAKTPDVNAPLAEKQEGGLGLFIVKKICDKVTYEYKHNYNIITVSKKY